MTDTDLQAMSIEERNNFLDTFWADQAGDEYDADAAYERHLEGADWAEQSAFADWEIAIGRVA